MEHMFYQGIIDRAILKTENQFPNEEFDKNSVSNLLNAMFHEHLSHKSNDTVTTYLSEDFVVNRLMIHRVIRNAYLDIFDISLDDFAYRLGHKLGIKLPWDKGNFNRAKEFVSELLKSSRLRLLND